jgi:signal transduction histidine kinase
MRFGSGNSLSLAKQGLILVSILIGIELVFVGILFFQLRQAELESEREDQLKAIAVKIQHLGRTLIEGRQRLQLYIASRSDRYWQAYQQHATDLRETIGELKVDLKDYPEQVPRLTKIESEFSYCFDWMEKSRAKLLLMGARDAAELMNNPDQPIVKTYQRMVNDILALGRSMEERLAASPEEQRKLRRVTLILLAVGLLVHIGFALLVQFAFMKGITARLSIMVDNTERLKRGQPLLARIQGSDEISILDGSFHRMSEELAESQQAKQAFVAMISHDLRTPLTAVQAFLYLMTSGALGEIDGAIIARAEKISESVARLIRLIKDLLDLEKLQAGKMDLSKQQIHIEDVIERAVEAVKALGEQNDVRIVRKFTTAEIFADPDRLEQVLVNLLSNACKYSPTGGKVKIETIDGEEELTLEVIDEGCGVPSEFHEVIFEKYRQVRVEDSTKKGGTGLGLPICKLIVEQHGGTIGVTSSNGNGSRFWFKLPKEKAVGSGY